MSSNEKSRSLQFHNQLLCYTQVKGKGSRQRLEPSKWTTRFKAYYEEVSEGIQKLFSSVPYPVIMQ